MYLPLAILSTFAGAAASLVMIVLLLAGSPNSSPQQLAQIKWMMIGVALMALAGIVGAIWAMVLGRHLLASGIGIAPALGVVALFTVLLATTG